MAAFFANGEKEPPHKIFQRVHMHDRLSFYHNEQPSMDQLVETLRTEISDDILVNDLSRVLRPMLFSKDDPDRVIAETWMWVTLRKNENGERRHRPQVAKILLQGHGSGAWVIPATDSKVLLRMLKCYDDQSHLHGVRPLRVRWVEKIDLMKSWQPGSARVV